MTAERILAATQELMADRTFEEISVSEIVHRAHASPSSFYARFLDKDALLGCLYERHSRSQRQFIDELLSTERWRDIPLAATLRATFPAIFEQYRVDQGLIRAFFDLASSDERFKQTWAETGNYIVTRVQDLIRARTFEVTHPDPMTALNTRLSSSSPTSRAIS